MMTKAKPMTPKSQASTPKGNLKGVKNTPIGKNKTPKFKATPTGKVTLINGTPKSAGKQQNVENNTPKGKANNSPKGKGNNTPHMTPKNKGNGKANTPNTKQNSPQGKKKNTPKGKSPGNKIIEQLTVDKIIENDDESEDYSDDDINEGVQINEDVSDEEVDSDAEEESDEDGIVGILGKSLADDSDDDDADFDDDDDDDDEDDKVENKGVQKFKGLKPSGDEDEEEEDSSDEDDGDDSLNDSGPGLKALLKTSLIEDDDDDDEDFSENDEEEDDDDDISEDDEEEEQNSPVKNLNASAQDDDDEEDEDSEDAEDDEETSKLSILENDSDEDENENESGEESPKSKSKSKDDSGDHDSLLTPEEIEEREKRSIYVGNLPKDVKKGSLASLFKQFGVIEALRFRGAVGKDANTSKKVAVIKRELHPDAPTLHAYIRFSNIDSAKKALSLNGHKLDGFYLRIDLVSSDGEKPDIKKAVFLGNLPFKIDDNSIWEHFADCGKILSVRIVRDRKTGAGKGFGYVNFEKTDSVALALKLSGTTLQSREIRVKPCTDQPPAQKNQKHGGQKRPYPQSNQGGSPKKRKDNSGDKVSVAIHNSKNAERRKEQSGAKKQQKRSQGEQQRQPGIGKAAGGRPGGGGFQGQKADNKKKQKFNKFDKKKQQVAAKLAAKPKKPSTD